MTSAAARYDGHSDWYDETFSALFATGEEANFLTESLGAGSGQVCLDVACGTGLHGHAVVNAGYRVGGNERPGPSKSWRKPHKKS